MQKPFFETHISKDTKKRISTNQINLTTTASFWCKDKTNFTLTRISREQNKNSDRNAQPHLKTVLNDKKTLRKITIEKKTQISVTKKAKPWGNGPQSRAFLECTFFTVIITKMKYKNARMIFPHASFEQDNSGQNWDKRDAKPHPTLFFKSSDSKLFNFATASGFRMLKEKENVRAPCTIRVTKHQPHYFAP